MAKGQHSSSGLICSCIHRQTQHLCDHQVKSGRNSRWKLVAGSWKWAADWLSLLDDCFHRGSQLLPSHLQQGQLCNPDNQQEGRENKVSSNIKWHRWLVVKFIHFCQFWAGKSYRNLSTAKHAQLSDVEELWGVTRPQTPLMHRPEDHVLFSTALNVLIPANPRDNWANYHNNDVGSDSLSPHAGPFWAYKLALGSAEPG